MKEYVQREQGQRGLTIFMSVIISEVAHKGEATERANNITLARGINKLSGRNTKEMRPRQSRGCSNDLFVQGSLHFSFHSTCIRISNHPDIDYLNFPSSSSILHSLLSTHRSIIRLLFIFGIGPNKIFRINHLSILYNKLSYIL